MVRYSNHLENVIFKNSTRYQEGMEGREGGKAEKNT